MTPTAILPILLAPELGIPPWLIQALLVFFFLVLPIVRSIRESLGKKKELERRRSDGPLGSGETDPEAEREEARRRFEALLRGEEAGPSTRAQPPPPPIPAAVSRPTTAGAPTPFGGALSDLRPASTEDEVEAADDEATADPEHFIPDEETRAREENDRRLRDERGARTAFLERERETGAGRRATVASDPMTSLGAPTAAATIRRATRPDVLFGASDDASARVTALRRAIVAAEVLGAPAALRDPATGPVGLRRPA